jgi:hypothetical protein
MSDPVISQSQQIASFWTKAFADSVARFETFSMEIEKLQEKAAEHAAANLDEVTRLAKESIAYSNDLAAAWRKLVLEGTKRTADIVNPATPKA